MNERESILIVDDDESTRNTLTLIFEKKGYETETAGTGREAIEQAQGRFFNLALLDIRLFDVAGVELIAPLKEMHPDMVVIIATAYASLETAVRALNCGASAYITKPLHMNEVLATVEEALEKQRLVMENRRLFQEAQRELAERVRTEAEREALIAELETKNTELERFTYAISHDLKSPLITIKGFLRLVEQDAVKGDIERLHTDIQQIQKTTDTMHQLLNDLLELSRIGRLMNPPQEVPFGDLAQEVVELVAGQIAERGVQITIRSDLPTMYGDRLQLIGILQNLIDNAIKFMGDELEPAIEIGAKPGANGPVLYVADNGIGINPRYHDKVFGLFERLDPEVEGTGMGLALVKRIIEVHGGRIWVESEGPGRGSTFYFTLAQKGE